MLYLQRQRHGAVDIQNCNHHQCPPPLPFLPLSFPSVSSLFPIIPLSFPLPHALEVGQFEYSYRVWASNVSSPGKVWDRTPAKT